MVKILSQRIKLRDGGQGNEADEWWRSYLEGLSEEMGG